MASIAKNIRETSKFSYITTGSFNGQFFNYTTTFNSSNFTTTGSLSAITGATPVNCPQGRILRANGKKLYPGGAYPGVSTMMIGVYDSLSLLSGFIDPNASVFALYNSDKSTDVPDNFDLSGTNVIHRGPPVFTLGDVIAGRQIRSTSSTVLATAGTGGSAVNINANLGQVFTCAQTAAVAFTATPGPSGSVVYVIITPATGAAVTITTNMKGPAITTTTTGKVTTLMFISDGTNLNLVSQAQAA